VCSVAHCITRESGSILHPPFSTAESLTLASPRLVIFIMDIKPGQQVEIMVGEATGNKFRACRTCKRFNVPLLDTRRTCSGCRQKRNESSRKAREKIRTKVREAGLATGDSGQRSSSPALPNSTPSHLTPPLPKRKAEQITQDLEGEDRRKKVVKTMELSLEVTVQRESVSISL
jgi:hypothetical protein